MKKTTTSYRDGLLKDIAESKGMTRLARHTKLNRESLYRMLSAKGNPQLSSLKSILASSNLRLAVEVRHPRVA